MPEAFRNMAAILDVRFGKMRTTTLGTNRKEVPLLHTTGYTLGRIVVMWEPWPRLAQSLDPCF